MNTKYFAPFVLTVSAMLFGFVFLYAVLGPQSADAPVAVETEERTTNEAQAPSGETVDLGQLPAAIPVSVPGVPPVEANPSS